MSDSGIKSPKAIGAAFPWLVEGLWDIVVHIAAGSPGLARTAAERMIAKLEGKETK